MKLRTPIFGGAMVLAATLAPHDGQASSHREAPFIAKNPKVDGTDFYIFNSYETVATGGVDRSGYVTILANYQGLQDGYGGPNYFNMDPDALYEIHIDNDGDGVEDITFQFDFDLHLALNDNGFSLDVGPTGNTKAVAVPFHTLGAIAAGDEVKRNVLETYTVNVVRGPRRASAGTPVLDGGNPFKKPADNAGPKTIADYATYSKSFIRPFDVPGCTPTGVAANSHGKVFVGQRKDGFSVNLGQIFDLINLKPIQFPPLADVANMLGAQNQLNTAGVSFNTIADKNVTTIALEVPSSCLVKTGSTKIGAWTTASVRQARVINPTGTFTTPAKEGGPWVQVSRLGMPLVNEVVIGLKDKNKFNNSEPKDDAANFATYVTNPSLPEVVEILFSAGGGVMAPNRFPRADLVTVFALGYPGVNDVAPAASATISEMVRLNVMFGTTPPALQSPYGAVTCFDPPMATTDATLNPAKSGCDPNGFPNGRRPGDDVVDVAIRAAMGALIAINEAPSGQLAIVDGAGVKATDFQQVFPYLNDPLPGAP